MGKAEVCSNSANIAECQSSTKLSLMLPLRGLTTTNEISVRACHVCAWMYMCNRHMSTCLEQCTYVFIHISMYVFVHLYTHIYIHVATNAHTHMCINTFMYMCVTWGEIS